MVANHPAMVDFVLAVATIDTFKGLIDENFQNE